MPVERRGDDSITSGVNREAWMVILNKKDQLVMESVFKISQWVRGVPEIRMNGNSCSQPSHFILLLSPHVLLFASPHAVSILDPASTTRWPPHSRHGDYGIKVLYPPR